ncbi:MAG: flavodoxin [Thermoplasmata archaeon]
MRALVVFYSKSGTTEKVAEDVAEELRRFVHVDVEEIQVDRYDPFLIGTFRALKDGVSKDEIPLVGLRYDPKKYEFVVVGSPVWGGTCPPPIRSYLSGVDLWKKVAFYTTQAGTPTDDVVQDMSEICNKEPSSVMKLKKSHVKKELHIRDVEHFVRKLLGMEN